MLVPLGSGFVLQSGLHLGNLADNFSKFFDLGRERIDQLVLEWLGLVCLKQLGQIRLRQYCLERPQHIFFGNVMIVGLFSMKLLYNFASKLLGALCWFLF